MRWRQRLRVWPHWSNLPSNQASNHLKSWRQLTILFHLKTFKICVILLIENDRNILKLITSETNFKAHKISKTLELPGASPPGGLKAASSLIWCCAPLRPLTRISGSAVCKTYVWYSEYNSATALPQFRLRNICIHNARSVGMDQTIENDARCIWYSLRNRKVSAVTTWPSKLSIVSFFHIGRLVSARCNWRSWPR